MRRFIRRPSPAMLGACLALLVALGGTSVAAVSQGRMGQRGYASAEGKRGHDPEDQEQRREQREGPEPLAARDRLLLGARFPSGRPVQQGPQGLEARQVQREPPVPPARRAAGRPCRHGRDCRTSLEGSRRADSPPASYFVTFTGANVIDKPVLATTSRLTGGLSFATATPCGGAPQGSHLLREQQQQYRACPNSGRCRVFDDTSFYVMVVPQGVGTN